MKGKEVLLAGIGLAVAAGIISIVRRPKEVAVAEPAPLLSAREAAYQKTYKELFSRGHSERYAREKAEERRDMAEHRASLLRREVHWRDQPLPTSRGQYRGY